MKILTESEFLKMIPEESPIVVAPIAPITMTHDQGSTSGSGSGSVKGDT